MKHGFTLVELLVVMAILAILGVMAAGTINPIAQVGKANDARRKKDLTRIRVAFEEYFNDTGCYPTDASPKFPNILSSLRNKSNCDSGVFSAWGLQSWPCDPTLRWPYYIFTGPSGASCPSWFKILTKLDNRKDSQIPSGWYVFPNSARMFGNGTLTAEQVNFGVSSTNINWND